MLLLIILSALLIFLAAMFIAICDTLADHYDTSIFKKKDPAFWDKATSSEKAKRILGYKVDGWHLSKSAAIICFCSLPVLYPNVQWYLYIIGAGIEFNLIFNLFYNKILRKL